ncbi:MAG: excinuclease subunit [Verrucomicrobiota bacterium]
MPNTEHIRKKLGALPHKPGVYLMKDRFGTVIYVGKARDLRKRVTQYFHPSRRFGWDLKFRALIDAIHDLDVHTVRNEPEALLLEGKLIKEFQPRYNISFRDDKRFLLLKVNLNDPIPRFTLTRLRTDDGARYFGPFAHSSALRNTIALVRRQFNLRGCRPLTPTDADYKHCLYANLKWCTAPCIGNVTRDQYLEQVMAACDFLGGQCGEMAESIELEMKKASLAQEFEKAAELRDALQDLRRTTQKTEKFERVPYNLPISINPLQDLEELARVLGLPAPPTRIEGFDISNISGTFVVASMVSFRHGRPDRANYRRFKMKSVTGQDDFASMAETIHRRYSRLLREAGGEPADRSEDGAQPIVGELRMMIEKRRGPLRDSSTVADPRRAPPAGSDIPAPPPVPAAPRSSPAVTLPDLILIDGGKGQLGVACAELARLGLSHIAIIGLAKEFEEIYVPGVSEPIRLDHSSGALKLLQRVRDESHRVANSYNAQLRIKRISESILDEFPGIGGARKAALLKKFGSVQRLRIATIEQISEVPGFGGKAGAELKAFLEARTSLSQLESSDLPPASTGEK